MVDINASENKLVLISESLGVNGNIHHALFFDNNVNINDKENIITNNNTKTLKNNDKPHSQQTNAVSFCCIYDTLDDNDVYESYVFIIHLKKRGEKSVIRVLLDSDMTITPTRILTDLYHNHPNDTHNQIMLKRRDNKYIQLRFNNNNNNNNTDNNKTTLQKWHKILCESLANITLDHSFRLIKVQDEINTKLLFNTIKVCSKLVGKDYPRLRRARDLIAMKQQIHVRYVECLWHILLKLFSFYIEICASYTTCSIPHACSTY